MHSALRKTTATVALKSASGYFSGLTHTDSLTPEQRERLMPLT
jgi:hypothetical protein